MCVKQSYLCGLLGALVEEVEGTRSLHSEQNNQTMSMNHWKLITLINQYIHTGLRSTECDYTFFLVTPVWDIQQVDWKKNVKKYSCYGNFFCMRCDLNQDKHFSADVFLLLTIIYIPCQEITYIRNYHQCIHCKKLFWSPVVSKSIFPFHKIQIQVE